MLESEVVIARIIPYVRELCQDSSQHVRAALANQITGLAPLLGHGPTIDHLLQLFLHLLKDEFPDVRLNIISKLEQVNDGMFPPYWTPDTYPIFLQSSESNYWPTTSYRPSSSLRRTSHGGYDRQSLNTFRCWPRNWAKSSLMNNSRACVCLGWGIPYTASGRLRPSI